jgi:hypothetical protein
MKAILEAESSPVADIAPEDAQVEKKIDPAASMEQQPTLDSNLLVSFNNIALADEADADRTLLEEKDALEIRSSDEPVQELFVPTPVDHKLSAQLLREWEKIKTSKKYKDIFVNRATPPAQAMKEQLVSMIQSKQVVVISGSTGWGKSTQTPQFILDACVEAGQGAAVSSARSHVVWLPSPLPSVWLLSARSASVIRWAIVFVSRVSDLHARDSSSARPVSSCGISNPHLI